jgi:anti-anti-sigma factor
MKTPSTNTPVKTSDPIFASTSERFGLPEFEKAGRRRGPARPFNLLLTTIHPESADAGAGEVVHVPVEFADGAVLLDLKEVTRIDSLGLALLLEAMQRITAQGGRLFLIRIDEHVRRILETAKLDQVFHIAPTRAHALAEHSQLLAA